MPVSTTFIIKINQASVDKFNKSLDALVKKTKDADKADKARDGLLKSIKTRIDKLSASYGRLKGSVLGVMSPLSKLTGILGGFGLAGIFSTAFHLNFEILQFHNALQKISDASGDTTKALQMQFSVWKDSKQSLQAIAGVMLSLGEAGLQVGPAMQELAMWTSNLSQATGISADKLAGLTGELHAYWGVSVKGAAEVAASAINTQKVFGTTSAQIELMIGVIKNAQNKLGAFFSDGEAGAKALAKGISMASGVLIKFGVNAQVATEFIDRLLDPEKFSETNTLIRMLGISFEDQMKMMESASGKEMFFDKLMKNLPVLSQKIQSIQNPLMRLQYAKNLGLPPEIAKKLAVASAGQIGTIIAQYKDQMAKDKLAKEKEAKAKAAADRYQDLMLMFKLKVLQPLMQFTMNMFGRIVGQLSGPLGKGLSGFFTHVADFLTKILVPAIDALQGLLTGDSAAFNRGMGKLADAAVEAVQHAAKLLVDFIENNKDKIINIIKTIMSTALTVAWKLFMAAPWWLKFIAAIKLMTMMKGPIGMIQGLVSGLKSGPISGIFGKLKEVSKLMPDIRVATGGAGAVSGVAKSAAIEKVMAANLSKGQVLLARALPVITKFAGPLAIAAGAIAGGITGFKNAAKYFGLKKGEEATTSQKASATLAGGATLGIAPLIDSMFDTEITPAIAKNLELMSKSSAAALSPLTAMIKIIRGFSSEKGFFKQMEEDQVEMTLRSKGWADDQIKHYFTLDKIQQNQYIKTVGRLQDQQRIELAAFKKRLIMGEKLTAEELKRANELMKNQERQKSIGDSIIMFFKKLGVTAYNFTFKIQAGFEKIGIFLDRMIAGIITKVTEHPKIASLFGISGAAMEDLKKSLTLQTTNIKDRERALAKAEEIFPQYEKAYNANNKGLIEKLATSKDLSASAFGINMRKMMNAAAEIAGESEAAEALRKQNEDMLKKQDETNKHLGGIGGSARDIRDVVAKPAPPSRADLIGAMIGTYGMTSWNFSI